MPTRITGLHVAGGFIAFFAVIVAVNVTMALFASESWSGLVVKNSYVASQQYNDRLAEAEAQSRRGYDHALTYADGALSFRLTDDAGNPVALKSASLNLGRPASDRDDRNIALKPLSAGVHGTDLALEPGLWIGAIVAETEFGDPWMMTYRFIVSRTALK